LQREANRVYGYTAQQTLDYVQSLCEKKLTTYPRTDSRYLTADMAAPVTALVAALAPDAPCDASLVVNPAKVSDHHAIIPTIESAAANLSALPGGERKVLDMLKRRLVCAVGDPYRFLETEVTLTTGGAEFKARGKTILSHGWKAHTDANNDTNLPEISEGLQLPVTASLKEGATAPPKHFTEDTLLEAMETADADDITDDAERKGLGTPATRAAIIEKLIKTGFIERNAKNLIPTHKAKNLIAVLPDTLKSPTLTAEWEQKLKLVEHGELAVTNFMDGIAGMIRALVSDNKTAKPECVSLFAPANSGETLGQCPRCGGNVREGDKGFFCDNSRGCGFKLWKASKFWTAKKKPLTAKIVAALLSKGRVAVKGLYSEKTGKTYDAAVVLDDNGGGFVNYKLQF
jgi:DNA topoisomerase-3